MRGSTTWLTVVAHPLPLFRSGIIEALGGVPPCDPIVGVATLAEVASAIAPDTRGLCLFSSDLDDAALSGLAALLDRRPNVQVIVMLATPAARIDVSEALSLGVGGILEAAINADDLASAVRSVLAGRITLAPGLALEDPASSGQVIDLTRRERQVLELMSRGLGNKAIAAELFISENTVRNHVRRVHEKLDARTRTEAVVRAARAGLLELGRQDREGDRLSPPAG